MEDLNDYVQSAASAADYDGLGVESGNRDSTKPWACYIRQSLEEQSHNNRLPDYLLTSAKMAKHLAVSVPLEFVLYDTVTGEHLERPNMILLRRLMAERRIQGVIIPALDRLSREPLHQQIFEIEATHYGIQIQYGDAPSGNDPGSQFARIILAHAAKLVKLKNRTNNSGGNCGRVVKGWVPAGRTAYGYRYRKQVDQSSGRTTNAWWEVQDLDCDGKPVEGSEAWVVSKIFQWIGLENRSTYWVSMTLNDLGIKPRQSELWSPAKVSFIIKRRCYTGKHAYNTASYVPNPDRPISDVTMEIPRTLRRSKPEDEHVPFSVPPIVPEALWQKANDIIQNRNLTKSKTRGTIPALFRGRVSCPRCGRVMTVRKDGRCPTLLYYICPSGHEPWNRNKCGARYIPLPWLDDLAWQNIEQMLKDPAFVLDKLRSQAQEEDELQKRLRLHDWQIEQSKRKIARIQQGWENGVGIYTEKEAMERISQERKKMAEAETTKSQIAVAVKKLADGEISIDQTRAALEQIRDQNLNQASFEEKRRIVELLNVKVYPCEDRSGAALSCAVRPEPPSHHSINMASPKLKKR